MVITNPASLLKKKKKKPEEQLFTPAPLADLLPQTPAPTRGSAQPSGDQGVSKINIGPGKFEFRIGDRIVTEEEFNLAKLAKTAKPFQLSEQVKQEAGRLGVEPFAEELRIREQGLQLAQQVGQLPPDVLADVQAGRIDIKQAIGAGLAAAGPGAATGAVGGALVGGVGAIPGAIALGATSFLGAALFNIRGQFSGEISSATIEYRRIEQNVRAIVTDTNRNPQNAGQNIDLFNYQMALMSRAYQELKLDDNKARNLGKDATAELARFEVFYSPGGGDEFLRREMELALLNPDPSRSLITFEEALEGND